MAKTQSDSETAVKCMNGERVCRATTNQNSVKHEKSASSQDSDPVLYSGPLCREEHFSGRKACTTTCLGHQVTSVLSDEISQTVVPDP